MKNHLLTVLYIGLALTKTDAQSAQAITIEWCYTRAAENYPMIKQREVIEKTREYSVSNASKGILPSITLNAQQSYQSDVTSLPGAGPEMPKLSKNQYKVYTDITEPLYAGGEVKHQKQMHEANAKIDQQKLEVELYHLKERVNQLFFGILLLEGQLIQNNLVRQDIETVLRKTNAAITNGTSLKTSADILRAELLKIRQRSIELGSARIAYMEALSLFVGQPLDEQTGLKKPEPITVVEDINRPELSTYDYQLTVIDIREKMLNARNGPRIYSFLQLGYGRPALNMLNNQADTYYVAGLRLNWTISGFYTNRKEKELLVLSRRNLDIQKETFLFNTNYTLKQQQAEVNKLQQLLATDDEIITLRREVKKTSAIQLENGVINTSDYLREVSAEDQASQNKVVHEVQLLMAQYSVQTTAGF
jgi:outer membrane protein TolC